MVFVSHPFHGPKVEREQLFLIFQMLVQHPGPQLLLEMELLVVVLLRLKIFKKLDKE